MAKVKVVQTEKEIPADVIAQSIVDISEGMKALQRTRLTRAAIVTLIHAHSRVGKREIELVMNNLESLEETWLKRR